MILTYFAVQEDQLIVNAMDLFSAGSETTATTLAWAVAFMIIEPEVILMFSTVDGGYRQCQNLDYMC
jgi:cytochrome P450